MVGIGLIVVVSVGFYVYLLMYVLFFNYVWGYMLLEVGMVVVFVVLVVVVVVVVFGCVVDWYGYCFIVGIGVLIWVVSLLWYFKVVGF